MFIKDIKYIENYGSPDLIMLQTWKALAGIQIDESRMTRNEFVKKIENKF